MARTAKLSAYAGVSQPSPDATGHICVLPSCSVPLGASLSVYTIRWSPGQTFERGDLCALLWRSACRHGAGRLLLVDHPLRSVPSAESSAYAFHPILDTQHSECIFRGQRSASATA